MKFISGKIDQNGEITSKLADSREIITAVFCCSPSDELKAILLQVPSLTLMYAQEYEATNPRILCELKKNDKATILFVPQDNAGRLHTNIYYGVLRDNKGEYVFIGSANLTEKGFLENREAGILLESRNSNKERRMIKQIKDYLVRLRDENKHNVFGRLEYERAIKEYRSTAHQRSQQEKERTNQPRCWVIIPREGAPYWQQFLEYQVIGHGFEKEEDDPKGSARRFHEMKKGDLVLIYKGFSQSPKDVPIYGVVRIKNDVLRNWEEDGPLGVQHEKDRDFIDWMKYWRETKEVVKIPKGLKVARNTIGEMKGSGNLTCQEIKYNKFAWFLNELEREHKLRIKL